MKLKLGAGVRLSLVVIDQNLLPGSVGGVSFGMFNENRKPFLSQDHPLE